MVIDTTDLSKEIAEAIKEQKQDSKTAEEKLREEKLRALGGQSDPYNKAEIDWQTENKEMAEFYTDLMQGKIQTVGNEAQGGNTVPKAFDRRLKMKRQEPHWLSPKCYQVQIESDENELLEEDGSLTASIVGENAAIPESTLTWQKPSLTAYQIAGLARATKKLLALSKVTPGIAQQITNSLVTQILKGMDKYLVQGSGVGQPTGLASEFKANGSKFGAVNRTAKQVNTITTADMETAYYALPQEYRDGAIILCRDDVIPLIKGLTTGKQGQSYWTNVYQLQSADRVRLGGYWNDLPVYTTSFLNTNYTIGTQTAGKAGAILFFNPQYLYFGDFGRTDIGFSDHVEFKQNNRVFKAVRMIGAQVSSIGEAFSLLGYQAQN